LGGGLVDFRLAASVWSANRNLDHFRLIFDFRIACYAGIAKEFRATQKVGKKLTEAKDRQYNVCHSRSICQVGQKDPIQSHSDSG
jgi:hypothetical protein